MYLPFPRQIFPTVRYIHQNRVLYATCVTSNVISASNQTKHGYWALRLLTVSDSDNLTLYELVNDLVFSEIRVFRLKIVKYIYIYISKSIYDLKHTIELIEQRANSFHKHLDFFGAVQIIFLKLLGRNLLILEHSPNWNFYNKKVGKS